MNNRENFPIEKILTLNLQSFSFVIWIQFIQNIKDSSIESTQWVVDNFKFVHNFKVVHNFEVDNFTI